MALTSSTIGELGKINGPRCCKRDAMIAFKHGIEYVRQHFGVQIEYEKQHCEFSSQNQQCIKEDARYLDNGKLLVSDDLEIMEL
ncbi:hypothetical protein SAMN02745247_00362 [Butyrivibrio hungatei DSM 14810]|uniref:DUF5714 domain-containing protein n=2 Tax=Butyrivibrio hungatei TaxID=185008 RepID=A0A1M7RTT8_9FIRM|nr:hypothetical protein SAMN02745247_00362 [Butyrivibrio hungatei DSM 14810]